MNKYLYSASHKQNAFNNNNGFTCFAARMLYSNSDNDIRYAGQYIQCESQKVASPLNFLQYFHSGSVYFPDILLICCQFISTHTYQFGFIYPISNVGICLGNNKTRVRNPCKGKRKKSCSILVSVSVSLS